MDVEKYRVYNVRWLLIAIECSTAFTRSYVSKLFSVLNHVMAEYFHVSSYSIDTLAVVDGLSSVPVCIILAIIGHRLGLRKQMLIKAFVMFFGTGLCAVGFLSRDFYFLVFSGRILMGLSEAILYITPALLAAHWFPKREISTAYALPLTSLIIGGAVSSFLFPILLPDVGLYSGSINNMTSITKLNETMESSGLSQSIPADAIGIKEQFTLIIGFSSASLLMCLDFILCIIFVKDNPPTPPSAAQKHILAQSEINGGQSHVKMIMNLLRSRSFLLLSSGIFFYASFNLVTVLLPSVILATFPQFDNRVPGTILSLTLLIGSLGALICGRLLDKFKRFKLFLCIGSCGGALSSIWLLLGHKYKCLTCLFIGYPFAMIAESFTFTAFVELLVETTYPMEKSLPIYLFLSFYNVGLFVWTTVQRAVLENSNEIYAVTVMFFSLSISLFINLFVKAEYKRMNSDRETVITKSGNQQEILLDATAM